MRSKGCAGVILSVLFLTGCATARNNQADIDALNARLTALQGQMAEKDQELTALKTRLDDERMAREAAEAALKSAERAPRPSAPPKKPSVSDFK